MKARSRFWVLLPVTLALVAGWFINLMLASTGPKFFGMDGITSRAERLMQAQDTLTVGLQISAFAAIPIFLLSWFALSSAKKGLGLTLLLWLLWAGGAC